MFNQETSYFNLEQFRQTSNTISFIFITCIFQHIFDIINTIESTMNVKQEYYDFTCYEDKNLVPIINNASPLPTDFPFPCNYTMGKFDKKYVCGLKELACCLYCNCKINSLNPNHKDLLTNFALILSELIN